MSNRQSFQEILVEQLDNHMQKKKNLSTLTSYHKTKLTQNG